MQQISSLKPRYDVAIVGAGPAGLTAAMYAARQGLNTAVIAGSIGGQILWAREVENFIGWQPLSGAELIERFREHVGRFDVDCFEGHLVNALVPVADSSFELYSREGLTVLADTVIIATGKAPTRLAIPGEAELIGKGVSYCATCDAAFFVGKPVAVIGPGESAADAALQLTALGASPVTLVNRVAVQAPEAVLARIEADTTIRTLIGAKPLRIEGEDRVEALVVQIGDAEERVAVDGVFVEMGSITADEFAMGLVEINDRGEIVIDKAGATNTPGIYAAGDVTDEFGKQVITAAGQGARAAMAAARDLKRR
ncbi:MAG: hypothetical protein CVT60_01695 [Actinobacteria bacterium HGW-Actinobacteria-10]|nr:MAG: hypothetical protein CVT60_01695 [Actinobacteria bacterium HGW-Actinobacteria-10]